MSPFSGVKPAPPRPSVVSRKRTTSRPPVTGSRGLLSLGWIQHALIMPLPRLPRVLLLPVVAHGGEERVEQPDRGRRRALQPAGAGLERCGLGLAVGEPRAAKRRQAVVWGGGRGGEEVGRRAGMASRMMRTGGGEAEDPDRGGRRGRSTLGFFFWQTAHASTDGLEIRNIFFHIFTGLWVNYLIS